eukprot:1666775-Rhodomonas_salina.4
MEGYEKGSRVLAKLNSVFQDISDDHNDDDMPLEAMVMGVMMVNGMLRGSAHLINVKSQGSGPPSQTLRRSESGGAASESSGNQRRHRHQVVPAPAFEPHSLTNSDSGTRKGGWLQRHSKQYWYLSSGSSRRGAPSGEYLLYCHKVLRSKSDASRNGKDKKSGGRVLLASSSR